jgi:hypothetical protein
MIFKPSKEKRVTYASEHTTVNIRCPTCRQRGTFSALKDTNNKDLPDFLTYLEGDTAKHDHVFGQRLCPDPTCRTHIFFVKNRNNDTLYVTYPAERIDFDATGVPALVLEPLQEAITCHAARCFTAAAIMIRKTLEELCRERGASGGNLKQRISNLGTKVVLPQELLDGLDDLRLLGNDAAHIESQQFNQVGQEEVEVGIEFTKEVLKAAYQYATLLSRLRGLKKTP